MTSNRARILANGFFAWSVVFIFSIDVFSQDSRPFPASWQAAIDQYVESGDIPGAVFVIKSPRWGVRVGTTGLADIANNIEPDPNHPFRVGSVTKNFTSMVILSLEQEGLLRLDDTIDKYLTDDLALKDNASSITIKECLQHTGGINNYLNVSFYDSYPLEATAQLNITPSFLINQINTLSPYFAPGDTFTNPIKQYVLMETPVDSIPKYPWWFYSNSHFTVLGVIAEKVTGKTLSELIRERVTEPAGLTNTFYANDESVPANIMRGYTKGDSRQNIVRDDWKDVTVINPTYAGAAGAVISTPMDLLRHLEIIYTTDLVINEATREKWLTFVSADPIWENLDYGVGAVMQDHTEFGDVRGHGGAIPGYHNLMYYLHDSDTYFVIVVNTWDGEYEVTLMDAVMPLVMASTTTPTPSNNASGVALQGTNNSLSLSWQAGREYGDVYDIYIGKDADEVDTASGMMGNVSVYSTSDLHYEVPGVEPNTQYYWRVDAVTNDGTVIQGPLWSLQTGNNITSIKQWETLE